MTDLDSQALQAAGDAITDAMTEALDEGLTGEEIASVAVRAYLKALLSEDVA